MTISTVVFFMKTNFAFATPVFIAMLFIYGCAAPPVDTSKKVTPTTVTETPKTVTAIPDDGLSLKEQKLFAAIAANDLNKVQELISNGTNIDVRNSTGRTPLIHALDWGYNDIALYLIEAGADIHYSANTPSLFSWISNDQEELFSPLFERGIDIFAKNEDGQDISTLLKSTPKIQKRVVAAQSRYRFDFLTAIRSGDISFFQNHINRGWDVNFQYVNSENRDGDGSALLALAYNQKALFDFLIENKADVNLPNKNGGTPLMIAVHSNRPEMVSTLLKAGANPNLTNNEGWTALHASVNSNSQHDKDQIAKQLITAGVNINARNKKGATPLLLAVINNKPKTFAALIAAKADPNLTNNYGGTPLMIAVSNNRAEMVSALLKAGANPNLADNDGWTALMKAVNYNRHEMVSVLLKAGANPDLAGNNGWTPLMQVVNENRPEMVSALLKAGANTNLAENDGWTALHLTAHNSDTPSHDYDQIAKQLIAAGANINAKNKQGASTLMLAAYNNKPKVARALIEAGADINMVNWEDRQKSALDYAVGRKNFDIADMLRRASAVSGAEQAKYPARPAPRNGYITCNTRCNNGDCYRTYSNGRQVNFQAERRFNPINNQWEWDSGSC